MDNVEIGDECIIGALAFVPADTVIPSRKLVVGNPAQIKKDVSDDMVNWKTKGTALYQKLPSELYASLKPCEPLTEVEKDRPAQESMYTTWNQIKNNN
jgi:carbonic anhydrase/acetyltransferase-like protein (isoleucine patch superfamily)